jgi:pyruvate, orthophosphate dikinase
VFVKVWEARGYCGGGGYTRLQVPTVLSMSPGRVGFPVEIQERPMSEKRVYLFREGNQTMRDLLGGKGANLAEMTNIGLPVPPGFTITTDVCREYYATGKQLPTALRAELETAVADVEKEMGRTFGGSEKPLLVSVRSGSKFSMPGMMDTVLNLGLNETTVAAMIKETGNARFVYDSYRRLTTRFSLLTRRKLVRKATLI